MPLYQKFIDKSWSLIEVFILWIICMLYFRYKRTEKLKNITTKGLTKPISVNFTLLDVTVGIKGSLKINHPLWYIIDIKISYPEVNTFRFRKLSGLLTYLFTCAWPNWRCSSSWSPLSAGPFQKILHVPRASMKSSPLMNLYETSLDESKAYVSSLLLLSSRNGTLFFVTAFIVFKF